VCVCLSVCLFDRISETIRAIFTKFFVHIAYSRGSVLLLQGDEIPRGGGNFGVFLPLTMHCNAFAANNVMQQQNGPFRRCQGVVLVHSVDEV